MRQLRVYDCLPGLCVCTLLRDDDYWLLPLCCDSALADLEAWALLRLGLFSSGQQRLSVRKGQCFNQRNINYIYFSI
jgi:hypothetical protein